MTGAAGRRIDAGTAALLAMIVVAGAGLRFWALGANSVWIDEGFSWFQSSGGLAEVFSRTAQDNYPPLHNLFLWLQIRLFGDSETSLRMPSALFATLEIPVAFMLGRALAGNRAGLIAAALLALSPVHLYQAHNARMYTLFSLTATLYLWTAMRHIAIGSLRSAALGGLAAVAMLHTHPYALLVFASVNAVMAPMLFVRRRAVIDAGLWLAGQAAAFIIFIPWFVNLVYRARHVVETGFWTPEPSGAFLREMALELFPGPMPALAGAVAAAGLLLWLGRRVNLGPSGGEVVWGVPPAAGIAVLAAAIAGPVAIAWLMSVTVEPVMYARYFIHVVPVAAVLLAAALVRLPVTAFAQAGAVVVACLLLVRPAIEQGTLSPVAHSDWRDLVATQKRLREPQDRTILFPTETQHAWAYYARDAHGLELPETAEVLLAPRPEPGRVWVIIRWNPAVMASAITAYRDAGYELRREFPFRPLQMVLLEHP